MDECEGCSGKKKKGRTLEKDKSSGTQEADLSALGQKLGHFTATQPFLVLLHCLIYIQYNTDLGGSQIVEIGRAHV